jgi:glycosyltransferase involved in cell wall biosynthesis
LLFSVIITSYNRASSLHQAIEAVLAQTYRSFEIIVVDDASSDGTEELLKSYKDRVIFFSTGHNSGGPAIPRNRGLQQAKGDWICFCDSDDEYRPDHLEKLHAYIIAEKPGDAIISTNALTMRGGRKSMSPYFPDAEQNQAISLVNNWKSSRAIFSSMCIRNAGIVKFKEDKQCQSIEDYIFLLENMLNGKRHIYLGHSGIYYNEQSDDSLRFIHFSNGLRLYHYKLQLWKKYRLWRTTSGIPLLAITAFDFLKYKLKKLVK